MAPRGRSRNKNTRMQAALEAMRAYGFSNKLIKKKLKELLSVYGEDNWLFIEENSYKVLIDNILEHQEQQEQQKDDTLAGLSTAIIAPPCSGTEALDIALSASDNLESASPIHAASDTALVIHESDGSNHMPPSGEATVRKNLNLNRISWERRDTNIFGTSDKNSGGVDLFGNPNLSPRCASVHSEQQPKDNIPIRKRKPCHGWISNDNEEVKEECLIHLEPTPLPADLVKLLFNSNVRSRRRTRWDLRPEDLL